MALPAIAVDGASNAATANQRRGGASQLVPVVADMVSFLRSLISPDFQGKQADMVDCIRSYLDKLTIPEAGLVGKATDHPGQDLSAEEEGEPLRTQIDELLMQMSIADDGQNGHYGLTSFVWQTPSADVLERLKDRIQQQEDAQAHASPVEQQQAKPQDLAVPADRNGEVWVTDGRVGPDGAPDPNEAGSLRATAVMLKNWENCDMALSGQYFNNFLLNVICASAVRFSDQHVSEGRGSGMKTPRLQGPDFLALAKSQLMEEIDKGLLILGQMECSAGRYPQGWLYTGMAFRAMRDFGIHLNISRLPIFGFGTLTVEDREIRRRLFWYPTFNAFQNVSPGPIVDDTEDDDEWYPYTEDPIFRAELADYPVQKALTTCNNRYFIKLCEIIQKIIGRLYNGRPKMAQSVAFARTMSDRLKAWFDDMPTAIKLEVARLPLHCPPPHIFSLNVLYRASWILLHRVFLSHELPFQSNAPPEVATQAGVICSNMAEEMHQLFTLHNKSFKLRNMTYTTSWSMYSAALVNAMDFRNPDPVVSALATPRIMFSLHVLERASLVTPGIKRSIDLIKKRLVEPIPPSIKRPAGSSHAERSEKRQLSESASSRSAAQPTPGPSIPNAYQNVVYDDLSLDALMSSWGHVNDGTGLDLLQDMTAMPSVPTADTVWQGADWVEDFWRS
ncbi:uncharacterized protein MKK02DRAFT_42136 [Dioszegia hungarica]|uniref:Xylanolytic transcriptional activator regulatory domain-containing protein n=1 Tax=Dioszegia hungarica TaxID=4972 RepID=A0AA38HF14_9TREE|nr:uncharacterized protein MKK02DRAFT_42136 [Dioszegia hungarica]KAI9637764.1 hypothetical protein MKK02DRAFT_42136 [Dioszegia hungarica]